MNAVFQPGRLRMWVRGLADRVFQSRFAHRLFSHAWLMALAMSAFLALLIAPHFAAPLGNYSAGSFAQHAIKANRDFDVEDPISTGKRRDEAATLVNPIFDHDSRAEVRQADKLDGAFDEIRLFFGVGQTPGKKAEAEVGKASLVTDQAVADQVARFQATLGIELDDKSLAYLAAQNYDKRIQEAVRELLKYALTRLIVVDRDAFVEQVRTAGSGNAITLRELDSKKERTYTNFDQVWDIPTAKAKITERAAQKIDDAARRRVAVVIAKGMLGPTLDFNRAATEETRAAARTQVGPSIIHFRRNQLIVAEGQQITEDHLRIIRGMQEGAGAAETTVTYFALVILMFTMLMVLVGFARQTVRKFKPVFRDYAFLVGTAVLAGVLAWMAKIVAGPMANSYAWLSEDAVRFLFPVAGVCILVRFLMYSEAALVWIAFVAPMTGLIMDGSVGYAVFVLTGSVVGAQKLGHGESTGQVVRAGLWVALVNGITAVAIQVIADPVSLFTTTTPVNVAAAMVGGLLAGPFVLAAMAPFEAVFGYTSNLRLMELANLNHPLLDRMLMEAPGTYHHSVLVSALAEKGAQAIGANPLLAKVAGLYHDIGKINKPHYFIENQLEHHNPHDGLPPHMSSLILINHVREGLDLARRYRLGDALLRVISEHHGKARINFFYNRAKQIAAQTDREKVNEEDFRYRGPYPQSKESALIMLADVVEAATRSLGQSTPARIETAVNELIGGIYNDGQLDECEMTLKDLHKVALEFTTVLTGRYHGRIEYPEPEQSKKGKVVNIPKQTGDAAKPPAH